MNLPKAIEILETEAHLAKRQPETGIYNAIKLGVEALKRIQRQRSGDLSLIKTPLPGETKE